MYVCLCDYWVHAHALRCIYTYTKRGVTHTQSLLSPPSGVQVEATSFVSPKWVPQMGDNKKVSASSSSGVIIIE